MLGLFNFLRFNYTYDPNTSNSSLSSLPISTNVRLPIEGFSALDKMKPEKLSDSTLSTRSSSSSMGSSKRISFSNKCKVVLIPTRKEYTNAGVDLWFSDDVAIENRMTVKQNLETFLRENQDKKYTFQEALKIVIQNELNQIGDDDVKVCVMDDISVDQSNMPTEECEDQTSDCNSIDIE